MLNCPGQVRICNPPASAYRVLELHVCTTMPGDILIFRKSSTLCNKMFEQINASSKVAGHKISIQISVAFLCFNNYLKKMTVPFIVAVENSNLEVNLTKEVKDLDTKNYEALMKEGTYKWKDIPCLWIRRVNIVKMSILHAHVYRNTVHSS